MDLVDGFFDFAGGMNSGVAPVELPRNQTANATNCTMRGNFVRPRPPFRRVALNYGGNAAVQTALERALFQGACYYQSDGGVGSILAAVGGRLFQITPGTDATATVAEQTIAGDPNPPTADQAWLWQAENYCIWNDGQSVPVFFDGTSSRRAVRVDLLGTINGSWTPPGNGSTSDLTLNEAYTYGPNQLASIGSGTYSLSPKLTTITNTDTLQQLSSGHTDYTNPVAITYDPNFIGQTTASFLIPAVTTPAQTTAPIDLTISVQSNYTPSSTSDNTVTVQIKPGSSGVSLSPTSGTIVINGYSFTCTASKTGTDGNGYNLYSAVIHNPNNVNPFYEPAIQMMTLAGQTVYNTAGFTTPAVNTTNTGTTPATIPSSGSLTVNNQSYNYTQISRSDNGTGTVTFSLKLTNYNAAVGSGAATGTNFTLNGFSCTLKTTIPAVTTASGTVPAQTHPVSVSVDAGLGNVSVGAYLLIGANTYSVQSVTNNANSGTLVLLNLTNNGAVGTYQNTGSVIVFTSGSSRGTPILVGTTLAAMTAPGVGNALAVPVDTYFGSIASIGGVTPVTVWVGNNSNPGSNDRYLLTNFTSTQSGDPKVVRATQINDQATAAYPDKTPVKNGAQELPPGRAGAYGMGRNWVCGTDGLSFIASDLVGGSSGTSNNNYRDAVLKISENTYLNGGGSFRVPGSAGDIRAMQFVSILDASLGQGPLQVLTPNVVFSCNAPVDRTTWQDSTNPILTESLISNGGLGSNSAVIANGDLIFRSLDGIRSLILARRDFNTWGNVPISREVGPTLSSDNASLLKYSSAIVFDNRLLMTSGPVRVPFTYGQSCGVYHTRLVALNFDPVSSLRGKASSIYDGVWTGLNILQMVKGQFGFVERAFALCYNPSTLGLELWEIEATATTDTQDNGVYPIAWSFESPVLLRTGKGKSEFDLCRLVDGELYVDQINGPVAIEVYFRPDYDTTWHSWYSWAVDNSSSYRTRMGLGEPPKNSDPNIDRPWREGYAFQVKVVVTGFCRLMGARFSANLLPQPKFAKQLPAI